MMKMYIPEIGDCFALTSDWTFDMHSERRNITLMKKLSIHYNYRDKSIYPVTIIKDTVLKVDRIYIRKGNSDFSSITFYIVDNNAWKGCRFWAKLKDVNKICYFPAKDYSNLKVSFSKSIPSPIENKIYPFTETSFTWDYKTLKDENICTVNSKNIIVIDTDIEERNLTIEEAKLLNIKEAARYNNRLQRHFMFNNYYSVKDIIVTKHELKAIYRSTGEVIGTARTTTTLSKKIKKFLKNNYPEII